MKYVKSFIEKIIFGSKWILIPFYIGLIIAQVLYCWKFVQEVIHLCHNFRNINEAEFMLVILTLIDITMIANLIKMIIVGSYQTFIEKVPEEANEKISSGLLKVKMGGSLVGVSSIHLLQSFINTANYTDRDIIIKAGVHVIFLISTMGLAYIDYISHKNETHGHDEKH